MSGTVHPLRFSQPVATTPGLVTLRFGEGGGAPSTEAEFTLQATLPPAVTVLGCAIRAEQDHALPDAFGTQLHAPQAAAALVAGAQRSPHSAALQQHHHLQARATNAAPSGSSLRSTHIHAAQAAHRVAARQSHAARVAGGVLNPSTAMLPTTVRIRALAAQAVPAGQGMQAPSAETRAALLALLARQAEAEQITRAARTPHATAAPHARHVRAGQSNADWPWPGLWLPPPVPPPKPEPASHVLRFTNHVGHVLRFGWVPRGAGPIIIPVRESYTVLNSASLVRADTGQPVHAFSLDVSIDADSFCWSWSASVAGADLALVRSPALGEFVELLATINGVTLRLVVESIERDRSFDDGLSLRVSGRGRAAWLSDPHSPIITRYNATTMTAQQIMEDALTVGEGGPGAVPIGWEVDWRIEDWLVPAGAWSYTGHYIGAVQRIAEAGGAIVQAHNTDQTIIIMPRYPAAPWHWGDLTPDLILPEDVCVTEGISELDKPGYNSVVVVGVGHRADHYRRIGTAADRAAPQIVDALATAPEMTRQRATAALSDTGRQQHIRLRLPLLPETGIIMPGTLIDYTAEGQTHRALTRGVSVTDDGTEIWQTITTENHVLEPV